MRKLRGWLVLVCVGLLVAGCGGEDSAADATPQPTLEPEHLNEGIFDGEPIRYTVDLQAGQLLLAEAKAVNMDMELTLYDTRGRRVAYDDDGGEGLNALLAYVAQVSGTYSVEVDERHDDRGFSYSFSANLIDPVQMEINSAVQLEPQGKEPLFVVFAGEPERVFDLSVISATDDNLWVILFDAEGQRVDSDGSDGPDYTAYMRRIVLTTSGLHLIRIEPTSDNALTGTVSVRLEGSARLFLTDTPHEVTFGRDRVGLELFTLDVVEGTTYRLIVENVKGTGFDLRLDGSDETIGPDIDLSLASRIAWDFRATNTGLWELTVRPESRSDPETLRVSLEVVE